VVARQREAVVSGLTDRQLDRLAWACWWLFVAAMAGGVLVTLLDPRPLAPSAVAEDGVFLLVLLPFPLAGVLILRRQPRNSVGWLLTGIGLLWGIGGLADGYAQYGLEVDPGSLPGPLVAAVVANGIWAPALGLTGTFLFLLFPDGHLPSPRWRPVALLSGALVVLLTVSLHLMPERLVADPGRGRMNPLGIRALGPFLDVALDVLVLALAGCVLASVLALATRFHRARGIERQQLKWLATAAAVVGGSFVLGIAVSLGVPDDKPAPGWMAVLDQLSFLLFALIPLAIGIAVLRHRLYDIDVVINRALVYGALTATLVTTYLGSVLLLQVVLRPLTERSDLAVAASTLAVAALFGPARRRIQVTVDRRFYRQKYDAARTVADFTTALRRQIDLDTVGADLLTAVHETVQPTSATIWMPGTRVGP
jgi:hypothetical protein